MTSATKWLTFACLAITPCFSYGADTAALAKRLHKAADASSLDDASLKSWHLKLDVQLYDAKGNPSEQGTIEEWWTPDTDKRTYISPSYKATEIHAGKIVYRTSGQPTVPYLLNAIRERVVHPMAPSEEIDGAKPDLRVESFGNVKLDCIMLDQQIKGVAFPPLGLFPTYCLSQNNDLLRLAYCFGSESTVLNSIGKFQGRQISVDPSISMNGLKVVSAHIATLEGKAMDPSIFAPGPEFEEHSPTLSTVGSEVVAGKKIKGAAPIYPAVAKANHTTGAVKLEAVIGTDGHIRSLKVIEAPDSSLAVSALIAVRQWEYQTFLLNGSPTEVKTLITVNYRMSP